MVFETRPRLPHNLSCSGLLWAEEPGTTARGGLGLGPRHGGGSAAHRGARAAGDGARGAGGGLATPARSLGMISGGSRLSETLDRPPLPTRSRFELRPCFGWRRARPGRWGRMRLHLRPGDGTETRKAPSLPPTPPPSQGRRSESGAGACTSTTGKQEKQKRGAPPCPEGLRADHEGQGEGWTAPAPAREQQDSGSSEQG